jgi:hypothetical protein
MEIRFAQSARKHRIGKGEAQYVMEHYSAELVIGELGAPDQMVWIGLDKRMRELEIAALVLEEYLLVVHVMPTSLRRRKRRWQEK